MCLVSIGAALIALMLSPGIESILIRFTDSLSLGPPGVYVPLLDFIAVTSALAVCIFPPAFVVGFAAHTEITSRLNWGLSLALLASCVYVWLVRPFGSRITTHTLALTASAVLLSGLIHSLRRGKPRKALFFANVIALILLTGPYWMAIAKAPRQPANAQKVWSVALESNTWQGMNTGSSFAARRQVVFAGDRVLAVFDAGAAPYEGKQPMAHYRLVSLDSKTGAVRNAQDFIGHWGDMPNLFATDDGHAILGHGPLTLVNPDLTPVGPTFTPDRGRAVEISPDGSTVGWETFPGTTLLDSRTLNPLNEHVAESVPTSISRRGVLTDNIYWYKQYPHDHTFVTLTDEQGQHLLFHGDCGGRPEFLTAEKVILVGCDKIRILNLEGTLLNESSTYEGSSTFSGVSQDGKRFSVQFTTVKGDPPGPLYEHFIIYDSDTAKPLSIVRVADLPEYYSWSALSADGEYFVVGNPNDLSLYQVTPMINSAAR